MTTVAEPLLYRLRPAAPQAHRFHVTLTIPNPAPGGQRLTMPAWIPGSYMIRDFARNLVSISARGPGGPLALDKLDKHSWRIAAGAGPVTVEYEVYAWDMSVRGAHLDTTHAYANGAAVFLRVAGQDTAPCELEVEPPPVPIGADWRVATSMPRSGAAPWGFGRYRASNYDTLIDHPIEMGRFDAREFPVRGVVHRLVVTGRHDGDLDRLAGDLQRICATHADLFGELPPNEYLFLLTVVGDGYGGLEHCDSTSLIAGRNTLPRAGLDAADAEYRRLLGLASHEYFHLWNVKRIQPAAFVNAALDAEVYTRQLWIFEGFTSYYDDLALVRAGLITTDAYLGLVAETITRVLGGSGRLRQSVAESSFDAWTRFYKQDENAPNAIVSYYQKGALVALALDLALRRASDGRASLDDLMRVLWRDFGPGSGGVPEGTVEQLASGLAGEDLSTFFARYVHGTEDPPLAELLVDVGVEYRLRAPEPEKSAAARLGVKLASGSVVRLGSVFDGGAAQAAGLAAGDEIVAIDGVRCDAAGLDARIARIAPGRTLSVHAFRRDELNVFELALPAAADSVCALGLASNADADCLRRRAAWLVATPQAETVRRRANG
ncbi:MAG: M61 family metallopeptidase [Chromatiales bacterium]|nr:M61 family metallopeptidase [Chromatiales bacterium]